MKNKSEGRIFGQHSSSFRSGAVEVRGRKLRSMSPRSACNRQLLTRNHRADDNARRWPLDELAECGSGPLRANIRNVIIPCSTIRSAADTSKGSRILQRG